MNQLNLIIMKSKKPILIAVITSLFAVLTVVNMSLASPRSAGENTLDMLEIMTRAFDEGEGGGFCPYASREQMEPDMMNNMCLGGPNPCDLKWKQNGVVIVTYHYPNASSEHDDIHLVCNVY